MVNETEKLRRGKVLLLAYSCGPEGGSEVGVGWNRAIQCARHWDTWVICLHDKFFHPISRYLKTNGRIPGLSFAFIPKTAFQKMLRRIPGLSYVGYRLWHRNAYRVARKLHQQVRFDLVHQVTLGSYREPGYLWKLDAPFIWGPMGGTQNFPWRFFGILGIRGGVKELLRNVTNTLQLHCSPHLRIAARRASVILASDSLNQRNLADALHVLPDLFPINGIPDPVDMSVNESPEPGALRMLWIGRFEAFKGLPLLLRALARIPAETPYTLRIIGVGPSENYWRRMARRMGVEPHITWYSWLPHKEALVQYSKSHVLVFTSLRETMPTVILEALASGTPVICLDHQGMAEMVTERCGIKIPLTTPEDVIDRLSRAIQELARDETGRRHLSRGAIERAHEYLWSVETEKLNGIYAAAIEKYTSLQKTGNSGAGHPRSDS